jgi:hypothetical protein
MYEHTFRTFDIELHELAQKIREMAALPRSRLRMRWRHSKNAT